MKCEHWDRLMVQVRKPGRPLTDCPHPKEHFCECNSRTEKKKVRMTMIRRSTLLNTNNWPQAIAADTDSQIKNVCVA